MKHLFWGLAIAAALVISPSAHAEEPAAAKPADQAAVAKTKAKARAKSRKATMGAKAKSHRAKYSPAALKRQINQHARIMARLDRIGDIAEMKKNDKQLSRVQKLRKKQIERHEKWLSEHADAKHEDGQKMGKGKGEGKGKGKGKAKKEKK